MKYNRNNLKVRGLDIVFEKKKLPKAVGVKSRPTGSIWDRVLDVIQKGDSFVIPHRPSDFGCIYTRAKKLGMKMASRTEIHGPVKCLRVYRVK